VTIYCGQSSNAKESCSSTPLNRCTNKSKYGEQTITKVHKNLTLLIRTMTLEPDLMPYESRVAAKSVRDRPTST